MSQEPIPSEPLGHETMPGVDPQRVEFARQISATYSPFDRPNNGVYGGNANRQVVATMVGEIADQLHVNGIYLDPRHKEASEAWSTPGGGKGSQDQHDFYQATFTSLVEAALTDRDRLQAVQAANGEAVKATNVSRAERGSSLEKERQIMTPAGDNAPLMGIDIALAQVLQPDKRAGRMSRDQLMSYIDGFATADPKVIERQSALLAKAAESRKGPMQKARKAAGWVALKLTLG